MVYIEYLIYHFKPPWLMFSFAPHCIPNKRYLLYNFELEPEREDASWMSQEVRKRLVKGL